MSWCKSFKLLEIFVTLSCSIICGLIFYLRCKEDVSLLELAFGYFMGFFERVIIERLPLFYHKASYGLFSLIVQIVIMRNDKVEDLIFRSSLTVIGFVLDYSKEKKERELFRSFYNCKEMISKFQDLLHLLPLDKILIFTENLNENLFSNHSFQTAFGTVQQGETKDFLTQFVTKQSDRNIELTITQKERINLEIQEEERGNATDRERQNFARLEEEKPAQLTLFDLLSSQSKIPLKTTILDQTFKFSNSKKGIQEKDCRVMTVPFLWDGKAAFALIIDDHRSSETLKSLTLASQYKDKVIATVSHELRIPLNSIIGMIQLLEKEILQPHLLNYLKVCLNSAKMLLNLVNSILDLDQIKNSKLKLNPQKNKLNNILEEITGLFEFQCQQKQLFFQVESDPNIKNFIYTDKSRLVQILINLLGNALKFTFKGGITLSVEQDVLKDDSIKFSVKDTGTGIKSQDQAKLFQMYGKLETTESINTQGIGLGLNISNTLAKLLNEEKEGSGIKVESEFGKGSTFSFVIKKELQIQEKQFQDFQPSGKDHTIIEIPRRDASEEEKEKFEDRSDIDDILDYDEKDGDKVTNKDKSDLSRKMTKYIPKINMSQINPMDPSPPRLSRRGQREDSLVSLNLDQLSVSPRAHLLSLASSRGATYTLPNSSRANQTWILIIDGSALNSSQTREIVESQGLSVEIAQTSRSALEKIIPRQIGDQQFKLVLMDFNSDILSTDGLTVAKMLLEKMQTGQINTIPIVVVTSNYSEAVRQEFLKAGMAECFSRSLFEENIKEILIKYL